MAPGDTSLTHDGTIYRVDRAAMTDPAAIARRMSADIDAVQAAIGFVSPDMILLRGWTAAQIAQHHAAALELSSRARAHTERSTHVQQR